MGISKIFLSFFTMLLLLSIVLSALKRALCVALLANWFWAANKNYDRKLETTQGRPQRRLSPYDKNLQKSSSLEIVCLAGFFIVTKTNTYFSQKWFLYFHTFFWKYGTKFLFSAIECSCLPLKAFFCITLEHTPNSGNRLFKLLLMPIAVESEEFFSIDKMYNLFL